MVKEPTASASDRFDHKVDRDQHHRADHERHARHPVHHVSGADALIFGEQDTRAYFNDGRGRLTASDQSLGSAGGVTTGKVVLADLNGDGRLDAVLARQIYPTQVWLNQGHGRFSVAAEYPVAVSAAVGDVNGDCRADLVLGGAGNSAVLIGDGSGGFTDSGQSLSGVGNFGDIALGDLNHDDAPDIVVGNDPAPSKVYFNAGQGHFADNGQVLPSGVLSVAVGDLNGDELPDIYFGINGDDQVWFNQGNMQFIDSGQLLTAGDRSWDVALGDVNGNGALDAIVASNDPAPELYLNDGTGHFSVGQEFAVGVAGMVGVTLADFNGDGHLDAIFANFSGANQVWFGDGNGQFVDSGQRIGSGRNLAVAVGDLGETAKPGHHFAAHAV